MTETFITENSIKPLSFAAQYIEPLLPYAELLYYSCGIGLLVVAIIGLHQIVIAKRAIHITSRREALKLSAEQCKRYSDEIIPLTSKVLDATRSDAFFDSWESKLTKNGISLVRKPEKITIKSLPKELTSLLNSIESFSQFFTCGLADERSAYNCLGGAHVETVTRYLPILMLQAKQGYWKNTMTLYFSWRMRKEREKLSLQRKELEQQMNDNADVSIPILGADCK